MQTGVAQNRSRYKAGPSSAGSGEFAPGEAVVIFIVRPRGTGGVAAVSLAPPNILWIVTTQWRGQAVGFAGDSNARTPYLDALAAEGVTFAQAVTPHPFGPFARAALLTGTPSPRNGVRDYFDPLPAEARTVAHDLRDRGYTTAFFGKWHLAQRDPRAPLVGEAHARMRVPPTARGGFDVWEGFESGFLLNDPWLQGTTLPEPTRFTGYQSDVVCARGAAWMSGQPGPWFCIISLESPHPPYAAPSGAVRPRLPAEITLAENVPVGGAVEQRTRQELAGYYAHIEATDQAIGHHVLTNPELRSAAVVVTSVHGDMHGAHGLFRKGWPYEESVRVPLVMRPPDFDAAVRSAAQRHALISLLDLGRGAMNWAENRTLVATRAAELDFQRISMPSVVQLPDQCDRIWRGVRTATRKLVLNEDGSPWLLFDLEGDPTERENRVADPHYAGELRRLCARLEADSERGL